MTACDMRVMEAFKPGMVSLVFLPAFPLSRFPAFPHACFVVGNALSRLNSTAPRLERFGTEFANRRRCAARI